MAAENALIRSERQDGVAILRMAHPPVNALGHALRAELLHALHEAEADTEVAAIVLTGTPASFSAGADTREFGTALQFREPMLRTVVSRIEECGKPVVAAVEGYALGGGLELALSCHARVVHPGAQLGLPEVKLGLIPGSGGTQRLPRLIGLPAAYQWMRRADKRSAAEFAGTPLVSALEDSDVVGAAARMARTMAANGQWRRSGDLSIDRVSVERFLADEATALSLREREQPAYRALLDTMQACAMPLEQGLAVERARFLELCASPVPAALRHLRKAERATTLACGKLAWSGRVGVIGAGTMGAGIARCALAAGLQVTVIEKDAEGIRTGGERVRGLAGPAALPTTGLVVTDDWRHLAECDVVIEAVFEDLGLKRAVFERMDRHAREGALLATNTSYLDVAAVAAATRRPESVVGLHFFSPADRMRLLEIVRCPASSDAAIQQAQAFGARLQKFPVVVGNGFGFVGNRLFHAYRRQCEFMLEDGAWPEEVDQALVGFGFAMGPFAVADLSGLDVAWRMRQATAGARASGMRYVSIPDRLCELGRFGRKAGAGYYDYGADGIPGQTGETVRALIREARARRGTGLDLSPSAIQRRALASLVNEAALVFDEGVAACAQDIDVVLVNGYGFPGWKGGPVWWARQQPRHQLDDMLAELAASDPHGITRASPAMLERLLDAQGRAAAASNPRSERV